MLIKRRLAALGTSLALAFAGFLAAVPVAHASVICIPILDLVGNPGCRYVESGPGTGGGPTTSGGTCQTNPTITINGTTYPCGVNDGEGHWWFVSPGCYGQDLNPQPPAGDPAWGTSGPGQGTAVFDVSCAAPPTHTGSQRQAGGCSTAVCGNGVPAWQTTAEGMTIAPAISMSPMPLPPTPPAVNATATGFVNESVWLWTATDLSTFASPPQGAGAASITVTRTLKSVDWDMGDGTLLHCGINSPGIAYDPKYGNQPAPDPQCSHLYTVPGVYTVKATATWTLSAVFGNGTTTQPLVRTSKASSVVVTIGEAQSTNG